MVSKISHGGGFPIINFDCGLGGDSFRVLTLSQDDNAGSLTIHTYGMALLVQDCAIALLLAVLNSANFRQPETGHRFSHQLV